MNAESQAQSQYYQNIDYALTKWAQMGYADQEVAGILGVAPGTATSDQSYADWNTAFQREQYDYEKQQAAIAAAQKAANQGGKLTKEPDEQLDDERVARATSFAATMIRSNQGATVTAVNLKNNGYSAGEIYAALTSVENPRSGKYTAAQIDEALAAAGF